VYACTGDYFVNRNSHLNFDDILHKSQLTMRKPIKCTHVNALHNVLMIFFIKNFCLFKKLGKYVVFIYYN